MSDLNLEVEMRGEVPYLGGAPIELSGPLADAKILVGSSGGAATARTVSGDVTISNTGVVSIGADKVAASELGVTAGTVLASKAVVVDASKDVSAFRNLGVINLDAGSSGVGGSVDIYASTADKGKLSLDCSDQDGNTVVLVTALGMANSETIAIPDPGANGTSFFVLGSNGNDQSLLTATNAEVNAACDVSAQTETIVAAGAVSVSIPHSNVALVGAGAITLATPNAAMAGKIKTIKMTVDNGDVTMALTNVNNVAGASAGTTCTFDAVDDCLILAACGAKWVVIGINGAVIS